MGWNNSRIWLLAPGWFMVSEPGNPKARNVDGTPVCIFHPERKNDTNTKKLHFEEVRDWLEDRGFQVNTNYLVPGSILQWEDVEAFLGKKNNELAEIIFSFSLTKDSPFRLQKWKSLIEQLCKVWDLGLYDPHANFMVDPKEFFRVLCNTQAWRDFKKIYNWPPFENL